MLKQNKYSVLL